MALDMRGGVPGLLEICCKVFGALSVWDVLEGGPGGRLEGLVGSLFEASSPSTCIYKNQGAFE